MKYKVKLFLVEFIKTFFGSLFCLVPFLFFYYWIFKVRCLFSDEFNYVFSSTNDPIVTVSTFVGVTVGSFVTYCWYGFTAICEWIYKKVKHKFFSKSADQKEA